MGKQEELDNLAKALVKQGLAASYADGLEKAKQILGIKDVIEKKRKDFLHKGRSPVMSNRPETDVPKKTEEKPINETTKVIPKNEPIVKEIETINKELEDKKEAKPEENQEKEPEKKESSDSKDNDRYDEEKNVDISEVFNYNNR